jgi:hypothetical protein
MSTDPEFIESLRLLIEAHQLPPVVIPPPVTSPTGRAPRLLWTPTRQATFNRMVAETHPWWTLIRTAALSGTVYADTGLWATIAYQATGDVAFVAKAWAKLQGFLTATTFQQDNVREYAMERVVILDWLWPGLSEAQRAQFLAQLDAMWTSALTNPSLPAAMPLRTVDSDQVTGVYMGLACYAKAFPDDGPAQALFIRPCVGGYDSTGRDRLTLRNCVRDYVEMAAGGEWIEGSEYNLGTVRLLLLGAAAVGIEHFPEVVAWQAHAAQRYTHLITPDLKQSFQWGDEQEPHKVRPPYWVASAMCFDSSDARQFVVDMTAQYGTAATPPLARSFLLFDPYGPTRTRDALPLIFNATGQGIVSARSSWQADASHLMTHFPPTHPNGGVDHGVTYFGDVQLYRQGSWALTHPITYGGVTTTGEGANVMLLAGFGSSVESRIADRLITAPGVFFVAGTTRGHVLSPAANYYKIPPFLKEYTRTIEWRHADAVDRITVTDTSDLDDPQLLANFTRYSAAMQTRIKSNPLRQWRWHCPVVPTITGNVAEWPIPSGMARLTWQRDDLVATVVDQAVAWPGTAVAAGEKKWHLHLTPLANVPGRQTLVTVLQFGDPTSFAGAA